MAGNNGNGKAGARFLSRSPGRAQGGPRIPRIDAAAPFRLAVEALERAARAVDAMIEAERLKPGCPACGRRKEPGIRPGRWPTLCAGCVHRLPAELRQRYDRSIDLPFAVALADAGDFLGAEDRVGVSSPRAGSGIGDCPRPARRAS